MPSITLYPVLSDAEIDALEGQFIDSDDSYMIYNIDIDVYILEGGKKTLLAKFRKNKIQFRSKIRLVKIYS